METDIRTEADIEKLIRTFYEKALTDEQIGFLFTEVAKIDLSSHLPKLYTFWSAVLLHKGRYQGNVMQVHIDLDTKYALKKEHFERWQYLFNTTVDELFKGPVAEDAKRRVQLMKQLMRFKIAQSREEGFVA